MERKRKIYTYRDERETRERGKKEKRESQVGNVKKEDTVVVCVEKEERKRGREKILHVYLRLRLMTLIRYELKRHHCWHQYA